MYHNTVPVPLQSGVLDDGSHLPPFSFLCALSHRLLLLINI